MVFLEITNRSLTTLWGVELEIHSPLSGGGSQGNIETQAIEPDLFAAAAAAAAASALESPTQAVAAVQVPAEPTLAMDEDLPEEEEEMEEEDDDPEFAPTADDEDDASEDIPEDEDNRMLDPDVVPPASAAAADLLGPRSASGRPVRGSARLLTRAQASSQLPAADMEVDDHEASDDEDEEGEETEDGEDRDLHLLKPVKQSLFFQPKPASLAENALEDYDMKYNHAAKGLPGLEQLLLVLNRSELAAVVEVQQCFFHLFIQSVWLDLAFFGHIRLLTCHWLMLLRSWA